LDIRKYLIFAVFSLITAFYVTGCGSSKSDINTDDPDKAFSIAKRKFDKKDYADAIDDFSYLKIRFPGTDISDKVQFYLAESYLNQKEYIFAEDEYKGFMNKFPLSPLYPEAKYKLGITYYELSPKSTLDQEYTKKALDVFASFVEQYPQDKNVHDAEQKMAELQNKLAYKDFWTAELYMKMDNYRAASLYYQNVYENYIDSEWADDAMVGQAEAYFNGFKYEEAKKILERFYKVFPKSNAKSRADKLKGKLLELMSSGK